MKKEGSDFTHINSSGNPQMVDIGSKKENRRTAIAESRVKLTDDLVNLFEGDDISTKKGPVFTTAIIAGVMGAKKTHELIPMCHPIAIENCSITIELNDSNEAVIRCKTEITAKTGVEMEALTGATIAALTIYDMCKSVSKGLVISESKLIKKTGGKSDFNR